ncbi:hypothetical protein BELL_0273g00140 [Botrytis elliptica]|uniref:Uncharacterized protein n=1 Tax=Botrytis elliptica TaxID=278938 RepID=A0A4Z1JZP0_9HELO|nr:hypothetical protein BELL_0273g00140 [Botrytis elliptica]
MFITLIGTRRRHYEAPIYSSFALVVFDVPPHEPQLYTSNQLEASAAYTFYAKFYKTMFALGRELGPGHNNSFDFPLKFHTLE